MAIELPPDPAILEERLSALEDPQLRERLFRDNPSLFADEAPRTQREVLAWTTRRVGTAVLAVTAALSIAAGYFGGQTLLQRSAAPSVPHPAPAVVAAPLHQQHRPATHPRAASHPATHRATHHAVAAHVAKPLPDHASAPVVVHPAVVAAPVIHRAAVVHPAQPDRQALILKAKLHAQEVELARLRKEEAAQAAALHAAALQSARAAAQARARVAAAPASDPVAQPRPRTEPATSTATATTPATDSTTNASTGPNTTPSASNPPADDPTPGGGVKTPPSGGVWTERIPTHGGVIVGPVFGIPGDSCTPRGGRMGIVMEAISTLIRH